MKKSLVALLVFVTLAVAGTALATSKWVNCVICHGSGACQDCGGTGYHEEWQYDHNGQPYLIFALLAIVMESVECVTVKDAFKLNSNVFQF